VLSLLLLLLLLLLPLCWREAQQHTTI